MPSPSFGRFSKNIDKSVSTLHMVDIGPYWIVEITDMCHQNDEFKLEPKKMDYREVHIINR
jgi:hypothetical protein